MKSYIPSVYRTHSCGALRLSDQGTTVTLSGWIHRKRDHGGVLFIDLRDHYGVTQIVCDATLAGTLQHERVESVIKVTGQVLARTGDLRNSKIPTGDIEVKASSIEVLSRADLLPFQIAEDDHAPEPTRLAYRFLELRRENLHRNIVLRSEVIKNIRSLMTGMGFAEFQTPILTSSSPEGARDFIVPSRLHPGKFYALPQAPQQFKQLLMISGFDRYFQIAPCFRDEDARADRSPGEFYQVDVECSFVEQEDVFKMGEDLLGPLFTQFAAWNKDKPSAVTQGAFPRFTYDESMCQFGSDKPDLRNPLRLADYSDVFAGSQFRVFQNAIKSGGKIRGLPITLEKVPPRKYLDDTVQYFTTLTGQGLAYLIYEGGEMKGSISKFVSAEESAALKTRIPASGATVVFLAAGADKVNLPALGKLLTKLGADFELGEKNAFRFCWITDFPFYELDEETGGVQFVHNPFTMAQGGLEALNSKPPLEIKAFQYDIVCNGYELASGGIRNHLPEVMYRAFEIVGYSKSVVDEKFGGMIKAFKYGAPPHGGFALGVDRIVMLFAGEEAIREVISFPLAQNGEDLLMGAPCNITDKQLREAHIQVKLPEANPAGIKRAQGA